MAQLKMKVLIVTGLFAVAVILVMIYKEIILAWENRGKTAGSTKYNRSIPDKPIGFGYKCVWFAIKTNKIHRIAEVFGLKNVTECNWQVGIKKAYSGSVFITPQIDSWTLACGWGLPRGDSMEGLEVVKNILRVLSNEFGEAQFFCTHRVTEYHCWLKARNGHIERVYSFLGESGKNIAIEGLPTDIEQNWNLLNTFSEESQNEEYFERDDILWADEDTVMRVAEHWSIDPTTLDERTDIEPGLGLLGKP